MLSSRNWFRSLFTAILLASPLITHAESGQRASGRNRTRLPAQRTPTDVGRSPSAAVPLRAWQETPDLVPSPDSRAKIDSLVDEILDLEASLRMIEGRARLIVTRYPISRISVADANVVRVTALDPTQIELLGLSRGETSLLLWIEGARTPLRYLVRVDSAEMDPWSVAPSRPDYAAQLNELFPNSSFQTFSVGRKRIVRGQMRDARDAALLRQLLPGR